MKLAATKFFALLVLVVIVSAVFVAFVSQSRETNPHTHIALMVDQPDPPFDSTADTVFDIIRTSDPSTFEKLEYVGRSQRRIWDKRVDGEPTIDVFVFHAHYCDGPNIEVAINAEYGSVPLAEQEAGRYVNALGQLPTVLRQGIKHFSVHKGNESFHAGTGQIVVYADKTNNRLSYNHLEESLFHESVHSSWDEKWRLSKEWVDVQIKDGRFLTRYGQDSPEREDLAESALFAYGLLHFPERIPPADTKVIMDLIPGRIEFVKSLIPPGQPVLHNVGKPSCTDRPL